MLGPPCFCSVELIVFMAAQPPWQKVSRRPQKCSSMGERALAEGLVTPQVAELFRSGQASSDLVSVVRASLAKGRPSSSGSEGSSAAAAAKAARNRRKLGAQTSLCWVW